MEWILVIASYLLLFKLPTTIAPGQSLSRRQMDCIRTGNHPVTHEHQPSAPRDRYWLLEAVRVAWREVFVLESGLRLVRHQHLARLPGFRSGDDALLLQ